MNRQQRRKHARLGTVNLDAITWPWEMDEETLYMAYCLRIAGNLRETRHPLHHKTANGVIVEPDPTLEYYMKRMKAIPQYQKAIEQFEWDVSAYLERAPDIPKAVPVNRTYYGHDPFEGR